MKWHHLFSSRYLPLCILGVFLFSVQANSQQFTVTPLNSHAQESSHLKSTQNHSEKCGHLLIEKLMTEEMGPLIGKDSFESWINQKLIQKQNPSQIQARSQAGDRLIPVVVHVIHNGEAEGVGSNIPLSQILNQIQTINEDFNRENPDANLTPGEFLPVAGAAGVEFVLAKQDPDGLPTDGIVRIQGPQSSYLPEDASLIGSTSQWNPEEYLNIWVVPLEAPFIGYASFPTSDLPGLEFSPSPSLMDGVTVDFRFFGSGGNAIGESLGRTTTHEIGHYLGLRHIWGDGGCGVDDFVSDTPLQDNSNATCTPDHTRFSCDTNDMIQNYMDYTPDACMNLFTIGQIERMDIVLANSPRRVSLVNNRATQEPILLDRDLAIRKILSPQEFVCDPTLSPGLELINLGNETIFTSEIQLLLNGQVIQQKSFPMTLETAQSIEVFFDPITLTDIENQVSFSIISVGTSADQNSDNDFMSLDFSIPGSMTLPLTLNLGALPASWTVDNPDGSFTWTPISLPISGQDEDLLFIKNYDYNQVGQLDYLISPVLDLSTYPAAQLVFEMAYAPYDDPSYSDQLIVAVSDDCGNTFQLADASYQKSWTELRTSPEIAAEFTPTTSSQFRTELVNLAPFSTLGKVRIAFISRNGFGNNIYLKNIRILPEESFNYALEFNEMLLPSPISDGRYEEEIFALTNTGNLPISNFVFQRSVNGRSEESFLVSGDPVAPGEQFTFNGFNTTQEGKNQLNFRVESPNFDQNGQNGSILNRFVVEDLARTVTPWRQNFNASSSFSPWSGINPEEDRGSWVAIPVTGGGGGNRVAVLDPTPAHSYWLGSPIFDLSPNQQAAFFFSYAAGNVAPGTKLEILASRDAGLAYEIIWEASGSALSTGDATASLANEEDFRREYINLNDFTGSGTSDIRLAAVLTIGEGENDPVYLDNLELFLNGNPNPVIPGEGKVVIFPNPALAYFNIAFNLTTYEEVTIQVISAAGSVVHEVTYPNTLNQTYTFSRQQFTPGLYLVRIVSPSLQEIRRIIIQ